MRAEKLTPEQKVKMRANKSKREQKSQNASKKVKTRAKKSKREQKSQNASKKGKMRA